MTDDPLMGIQLANFRLERILGRGGMAQVYYGWDVKLQRPVAVKVIDARFRNNPAYAKRFVREAQAVATWRHENIAQIHYADEEGDLYYFAMEYIDGLDLGQLLTQYASNGELIPQADVLRIGQAVANALDYAHAKGVVHRDVKPSNVIIARDNRVVLSDFGLALDVQQGSVGEVFGSAHYIAPEQARRSSDAIPQSDLYSLGIMLYEMLTGVVPFDDPSPTAVALQHITQPPPAPRTLNPELNPEIETVLLKALNKSPQERYQTGAELISALENAINLNPAVSQIAPLPLPPAGLQLPAQSARLSHMSVAEVIASQVRPVASSVTTPPPPRQSKPSGVESSAQSQPTSTRRPLLLWLSVGGCALLLIALVAVAGLLLANLSSNLSQNTLTPADAAIGPTSGSTASLTGAPQAEPSAGVTPASFPTLKYPDGKRFMLFYDNNSLYLLNLSDSTIPINWIAFERLSDADVPLNRFNGTRWAEFYADSIPGRCVALRILGSSDYLDPPECGNNNFLSLRTPTREDPTVFWTVMEGSHQFRVLWREGGQDEEIARCEIAAGTCEVFLP
jgi:serine/threonine protein kinase